MYLTISKLFCMFSLSKANKGGLIEMEKYYYYHKAIYMPDFDFEMDFWKNIEELFLSGHAAMRQHMRVFPTLSISKVREGEVYEVCIDREGIFVVCVRIPMNEGRDLYYIVQRGGLVRTGFWDFSTKNPKPSSKKIYEER